MVWSEITRANYERKELRYASDTTEAEWAVLSPHLPAPCQRGRPRTVDLRRIVNAILYIATTGCQWRMLPKEFPAWTTVQGYFYRWRDAGVWSTINHHLVAAAREAMGREASPTAGVIDSQSVKTTEAGGAARLRCRKMHQGTQTPHPDRHHRLAGGGHRPSRRYPGPRRGSDAVGLDAPDPSLAPPCLCRRRLFRPEARNRFAGDGRMDPGNHQAVRCRKGLRTPPSALGR